MATLLRRLTSGTFFYGLGQFLPRLVRFLLLPVFTLFLTPADYGVLELAGAAGGFLAIFLRLGLPGSATRFYFDYREGPELKDYITTLAWFLSLVSLGVGMLALMAAPWVLQRWLPDLQYAPFFVLAAITAILATNYELQLRLIQAREQASLAARLSVSRAGISIALSLLLVVGLRMGATGVLMAEAVVAGLFLLQAVRYLAPELRGNFRRELLGASALYGLGILPGHLMGTFTPLITRGWLSTAESLSAVGLLGIATRFALPMTLLVAAFQRAYQPVYFALRQSQGEEDRQQLATAVRTIWTSALGIALLVGLGGPALIQLMTPASFHDAAPLLTILSFGFLGHTLYTLLGSEIYFKKKTWLIPAISAASLLATLGVTALTVEGFGAAGVAWATVAGYWASALVASTVASRLVHIPHHWLALGRSTLVGGGLLVLGLLYPAQDPWMQLLRCGGAFAVFATLLWITGDPTLREAANRLRQLRPRGEDETP
ncbi:MAG: oligosaccharide flippase family protein [Acidobacteriota bacterium]|nr:oligosaccharide flippase family protein [Acidobacteriota bacterium]